MKHLLIALLLFAFNPLFSQKDTSQFYNKTLSNNNLSIELGGKGWLYSIGYERIIYKSKKILLAGTVNLSYEPFAGFSGIMIPLGINVLVGEKRNKLILGLSETNGFDFNPFPKTRKERLAFKASGRNYYPLYELVFIQPSVGYRRYFKNGNSLSIAFTPVVPLLIDEVGGGFFEPTETLPWFAVNYNLKF